MATDETLLRAVMQAPDDDAPRLAFADHVESTGDSDRAEFIRVQCALEKLPAQAIERPALESREKELLDLHGWDWAEQFGTRISEWVYRRGFIERVEMCLETSSEAIMDVLSKAPIRHLRDLSQLDDLSGFVEALPHLEHLTGLEFWCLYGFEDSLVAQMLASPHLRNLRTLILHHDRNGKTVDENVLIEAMASPYRSNLEELGVNVDSCWCGPSCGLLHAMAGSPHLRKLRKLNLSNAGDIGNSAQMDVETARCMRDSANFAHLEELDLRNAAFSIEVWDEVLKWPWLSNLRCLRLHDARQVQAPDLYYTVAKLQYDLPAYRKAFEERVSVVDWDTEIIYPGVENTCWRALTWDERPRSLLFGMNRFLRNQDYAGLETEYRRLCRKLAGEQITREIDELPFDRYEKSLHAGFEQALAGIAANPGQCIFFHLAPDVEWEGQFHVLARDPKVTEPRDESTYERPLAECPAGRLPEAARFYAQRPLNPETDPFAALYVLAKITVALGRCLSACANALPVYFRCRYGLGLRHKGRAYAVFRIRGD